MIGLSGISKTFRVDGRSVEALKDVSINIGEGEIYGIIGFSGAGKSTLVRCINLLERPDSGSVEFDGKVLTELSGRQLRAERKKIGMIFQQFNLMGSRTVYDNVAMPLWKSGKSKVEIKNRVEELLTFVGLAGKSSAYPSQLSGGQKQRVAIARALASDPKVLLCDEATSALDPQTTESILELLKKLSRELGITIVVITHEMRVVKRICTRVAVMEHGRVVEEGKVFDVFADPKQQITRDFIDTTSNLSDIYRLIEEDSPIVRLQPGDCIVKLQFLRESVSLPLLSNLTKNFGLECDIIFGDVEVLDGFPLGGTVVKLRGSRQQIHDAFAYLKEQGISVEVIKDAGAA